MELKVYEYKACSSCKKALQFLKKNQVSYRSVPIVDQPPTTAELRRMLKYLIARGGSLKNLFNTSGELYRSMKVSEKLKDGMTEGEAIELLAENGKLVKRPFVLSEKDGTVGFQEETWKELFLKR